MVRCTPGAGGGVLERTPKRALARTGGLFPSCPRVTRQLVQLRPPYPRCGVDLLFAPRLSMLPVAPPSYADTCRQSRPRKMVVVRQTHLPGARDACHMGGARVGAGRSLARAQGRRSTDGLGESRPFAPRGGRRAGALVVPSMRRPSASAAEHLGAPPFRCFESGYSGIGSGAGADGETQIPL